MRHFYLVLISLISIGCLASHIRGGEISWECLGNGQYIFYLDQYRECGTSTAAFMPTAQITGPQGTIQLSLYNLEAISPVCTGSNALGCNTLAYGGMELGQYKSMPVTLTGTPPPAGWEFSWTSCCRQSTLVNIGNGSSLPYHVRAKMYANSGGTCFSSPRFVANPAVAITNINQTFSVLAMSANASDSLHYRLVASWSAANTPVGFNTGYSATSPFPNSSTNALNGNTTIDHSCGLIRVDVKSATSGLYSYGVLVEQWQNNVMIAEVIRDLSVVINVSGTQSNNAPIAHIDTSQFQNMNFNGSVYTVNAYPGDTVNFEMIATDADYNSSSNQFQLITFDALGRALDTNWGGIASYNSKPLLSPIAPQSGFSAQLTNKISFHWAIAQEHYSGANRPHIFYFRFQDDECSYPGVAEVIVEVNVEAVANIQQSNVGICQGDSAQLDGITKSGQYQWSPSNGLSSTTVASPMAYPATSQYYYLTDPQNPGFMDSVYVDVTPKGPFNFSFSNGQLRLNDSAQTTTRVWYYNGVPFSYPYDTLTPFGLGDYYVIGKEGACQYISDTVSITMGMSFSVTQTGNGAYTGSPQVITGSQGVTFQVNQNVNVSWVSIPGLSDLYGKTGGYDLKLQLFDDTQTEIFSKDITLQKPIGNVVTIKTALALAANTDYTLVVSGDTGYVFSAYQYVNLPATPFNVGLTVKSIAEGGYGQFPTSPTNYLLPLSFGIDRTVDLDENDVSNWQIYPNPASEQVYITGLQEAKYVEVLDVSGKALKIYELMDKQSSLQIVKAGLPSGLYFVKVHFENTTSVKKVLFK